MTSRVGATCLMLAGTLACATGRLPKAGLGDIAFRLQWAGSADLDLAVESPLGEQISFTKRSAPSGGILDRDCNATPEAMCEQPLENVYWPLGDAPPGVYRFSVRMVNVHHDTLPIHFTVHVLNGRTVVMVREGIVSNLRDRGVTWEIAYSPRRRRK